MEDPCCGFDEAICIVLKENNGSSFYRNATLGTHQHGSFSVQCGAQPDDKSRGSCAREGWCYGSLHNGPMCCLLLCLDAEFEADTSCSAVNTKPGVVTLLLVACPCGHALNRWMDLLIFIFFSHHWVSKDLIF